ncbi:hypothetical protein BDF14DRAFT_1775554, partial [Spinellus fusiger]
MIYQHHSTAYNDDPQSTDQPHLLFIDKKQPQDVTDWLIESAPEPISTKQASDHLNFYQVPVAWTQRSAYCPSLQTEYFTPSSSPEMLDSPDTQYFMTAPYDSLLALDPSSASSTFSSPEQYTAEVYPGMEPFFLVHPHASYEQAAMETPVSTAHKQHYHKTLHPEALDDLAIMNHAFLPLDSIDMYFSHTAQTHISANTVLHHRPHPTLHVSAHTHTHKNAHRNAHTHTQAHTHTHTPHHHHPAHHSLI